MKRLILSLTVLTLLGGCTQPARFDRAAEKTAILQVMTTQQAAWNRGDLEGYMQGYWKSDSLRFASGGTVKYGWETTLQGYKRGYPDRAAIGRLTFSDMDVTFMAPDAAIVFGRWALERKNDAPHGLYTLLFRKRDKGWCIVADHTSAASE